MNAKFNKGQRVRVTKKDGEVVEGTINDWDYNCCTFDREYSLDYLKNGDTWTLIGIPESNIEALE
nr:MAG TPA: hypothetical protein [Caudoviricetes sp.]